MKMDEYIEIDYETITIEQMGKLREIVNRQSRRK